MEETAANPLYCGDCTTTSHSGINRREEEGEGEDNKLISHLWELPCKHLVCYQCFKDLEKHDWITCPTCRALEYVPGGEHYYIHLEKQQTNTLLFQKYVVKFTMKLRIKTTKK